MDGYLTEVKLEGVPTFEYMLTGLSSDRESYDISTFRFRRSPGGSEDADLVLRSNVFTVVGAITVLAGQIEAEMKRIVLRAEELADSGFAEVDDNWTDLEKRLKAIARGDGPFAQPVAAALKVGRERGVKKIRDDAVHSAWCLFDLGHIERSRFRRKKGGEVHVMSLGELMRLADPLAEYFTALTGIVSWPTATLPPLHDIPDHGRISINLRGPS